MAEVLRIQHFERNPQPFFQHFTRCRTQVKQAKPDDQEAIKPDDQKVMRPENQASDKPESQIEDAPAPVKPVEERQVNLCVKVPESWRKHWAIQAKVQDVTMTTVMVEALTERFGLPDNQTTR
ncbi:hypothetical protein IQ265_09720 [Nodosilinea sp. LEGE 06152]|uniref:hypothetical protein n=1 Tax=Nodosilinea sp. LEGE 06152 TaxID=2777966 RepID=UPI00187E6A1A|nr:hypothetical protein [Nodosilinea sp. LEGE 06152]MBE9157100.1 hypothetical protein [Nodosilinea sp. LEGE 06152]